MPSVTPPGDLKPTKGLMSEKQTRLRIRQERRRKRMFRVGAPAADLRFESDLAIANPVTAAQAGADATVIFGVRNAETGIIFSNSVLVILFSQPNSTLAITLPGLATGNISIDDSAQSRTITIGIDTAGQVKAWVNGRLVIDAAFTPGAWDDDTSTWSYADDLFAANPDSLVPMEVVLGSLPAIF